MDQSCIIQEIYWERLFLHISLSGLTDKKLYLQNGDMLISLQNCLERKTTGALELVINMSTIANRSFLENGAWSLGYFETSKLPIAMNAKNSCTLDKMPAKLTKQETKAHDQRFARINKISDENLMHYCILSDAAIKRLDHLDKIFKYGDTAYAYTVSFTGFTLDNKSIHLRINSCFMQQNKRWRKRKYLFEASVSKKMKKYVTLGLKKGLANLTYAVLSLLNRKSCCTLLLTETGDSLGGNLAAIKRRAEECGLNEELKITTFCRDTLGSRNTLLSWLRLVYEISKASVLIIDNYVPLLTYLKLKNRTKIVQVWHGGAGFKSVGYARFGKEGSPFPAESVHRKYTLALAPSSTLTKVFEEVFAIEKDAIAPIGMPRLDNYLNQEHIKKFQQEFFAKYPSIHNKKVILFAPTYRGEGQKSAHYDFNQLDFQQLFDFCGDDYVMLIKVHPFLQNDMRFNGDGDREVTSHMPDINKYTPRIIDLTDYPDINDLFYITDIFITDYSSSYYEYSILKRPLIFYTYDRLLYENTRGVYQNIKDNAPGKVCDNFDELMEALKNKDFELEKTIKYSEANFPTVPNGATDKLLDYVLLLRQKSCTINDSAHLLAN